MQNEKFVDISANRVVMTTAGDAWNAEIVIHSPAAVRVSVSTCDTISPKRDGSATADSPHACER
jgi:hypothetical protein